MTALMESVSIELEATPGLSLKKLLARVRGKDQYISQAIAALIEGRPRPRRAGRPRLQAHFSQRPFRAGRGPLPDRS